MLDLFFEKQNKFIYINKVFKHFVSRHVASFISTFSSIKYQSIFLSSTLTPLSNCFPNLDITKDPSFF